jgi:hypothetical protein
MQLPPKLKTLTPLKYINFIVSKSSQNDARTLEGTGDGYDF